MSDWVFGKKDQGPAWPVDGEGNSLPEEVAALYPDGQLMATSAMAMLHAFGIPAKLRYPGNGTLGKIVLGSSGYGVEILVPSDRVEEARALLEQDAGALADEAAEEDN